MTDTPDASVVRAKIARARAHLADAAAGLTPETADRIRWHLSRAPHGTTAGDLACWLAADRATARRYLDALCTAGTARLDHGRYRLSTGTEPGQ